MIFAQNRNQRGIFRRQRLLRHLIVHRTSFRACAAHLPASRVIVQYQINHAEVIAPHAGHHRGNAVQRTLGNICSFKGREIAARENGVSVAKQYRVDAGHLAKVVNGVFCQRLPRFAGDAGVRDSNNNIGSLLANLRHPFLAVTVISSTVTLPLRLARSQVIICGEQSQYSRPSACGFCPRDRVPSRV